MKGLRILHAERGITMKKIPCLFVREFENHSATIIPEVTIGCEWVMDGIGQATVKFDGTASAVIDGQLYARYDSKPPKQARKAHRLGTPWKLEEFNQPPPDSISIPCQDPDLVTGHWPHWLLVTNQPQYKYHREAFDGQRDGTYELMGPKVGGNPSNYDSHVLVPHGEEVIYPERTFEGIREWLLAHNQEGIVFHAPDGRMCKIRRRDFGLVWPI